VYEFEQEEGLTEKGDASEDNVVERCGLHCFLDRLRGDGFLGKSKVPGLVECGGQVSCKWLLVVIVDGRECVRIKQALWM